MQSGNHNTQKPSRSNIEVKLGWYWLLWSTCIRKKGFGPRETQVALDNFYSLKEYLVLWVAPDVFGCLWLSLGVFGSLWKSLEVFGCL